MLDEDGRATQAQLHYIAEHEDRCPTCLEAHLNTTDALNFLKSQVIEIDETAELETRILRRWRVERRSRVFSYWLPAVAGAVVAGAALLAVLQILVASPQMNEKETKGREALLRRSSLIAPPSEFDDPEMR